MDYELAFWLVVGIVSLIILVGAWVVPSDNIDITPNKEREWAREERKWGRK